MGSIELTRCPNGRRRLGESDYLSRSEPPRRAEGASVSLLPDQLTLSRDHLIQVLAFGIPVADPGEPPMPYSSRKRAARCVWPVRS